MDITVGLLWHTPGHGNLGVDALTRGHIAILQAAAERAGLEPRFVILSTTVPDDAVVLPSNTTVAPRLRLKELVTGRSGFLREMRRCDIVFDIGEGDSFTDIYGAFRFFFQSGTKAAVLASKRPLVLAPQTIGPFNRTWTKPIARALMRRCRRVYARDGLSTEALEALGVTKNTAEAIDVAFRLPFTAPVSRPAEAPLRVGINVSGLLFSGGYTGGNELGMSLDYAALVRGLIEALSQRPNVETWLVPHVAGGGGSRDDDMGVSRTLKAEFPDLHLAPTFPDSVAAKSFIAGLDFLTAGRMHACIGAYSAGVPVLPVAYSRKFNGLFATLGYGWLVDGRKASTADALAATLRALDEREAMKAAIAKGMTITRERLGVYEDELVTLLSEAAA